MSRLDRALAALPVAGLALLVLAFYCVEAWTKKTPWLFTDELEWAQLSRAIASTGHAARRTEPIFFKSVYTWVIAPFWWIHSTKAAYDAIKYANAVIMSLAAVPTYLLARLLLPRRESVVAAVLAVAVPAMSYVTVIIPEPLAYTWFALCSWLCVRALTTRRPWHVALAAAASFLAVLVKSQLELTFGAFVLTAIALWVTGPRGRALRRNWTRGDTVGALVLLVGGLFLFNRVFLDSVQTWHVASEYWKSRMVDLGLTAGAALAIGLGVIPVVAGFVALRLPERRGQPPYRAFAAYLASTIVLFSLYTAGKAAYLSTVFSSLVEERNLMYLSPLLLVATVLVFHSNVLDWRLVTAASVFVSFIVLTKPLQLGYPYFEAPGYSILTVANRRFRWDVGDLHWALAIAGAIGLGLLVFRRSSGVAPVATALLLAWLLAGEIGATAGNDSFATSFYNALPKPLNGIDLTTGGRGVTFLGQQIKDANGLWEAEFWNRSLHHVDSLDSTAPGPGPTAGPSLVSADGRLTQWTGDRYILAGPGIVLQGTVVDDWGGLLLYQIDGPWRLREAAEGIYSDGWAGADSSYTYYQRSGPGKLLVDLRRTPSSAQPGQVVIHVGTVRLNSHQNPVIGHLTAARKTVIDQGSENKVWIPVASTPVRAVVTIAPTFVPSASDTRQLGAQESFTFCPAKGPAPPACR